MSPIYVVADISRMFLSVDIVVEDQPFSRILWTDPMDVQAEPEIWEFGTVGWGQSTSPYLAMRALQAAFQMEIEKPTSSDYTKQVAKDVSSLLNVGELLFALRAP